MYFLMFIKVFHEGLFKKNEKFSAAHNIPVCWDTISEGRVCDLGDGEGRISEIDVNLCN